MKIVVVLANPDPKSFCYTIVSEVIKRLNENKHAVCFHDLYKEKFDPILYKEEIPKKFVITDPVLLKHCQDVTEADGIIIVHPNWWGQPPAIMTGWIDRVLRPGIAYEFIDGDNGEGVPLGLLKAKTAIVFNTSNTSEERENNIFKDPLEAIWKNCIFDLCGVKDFYRRMFRIVVTSTPEQRKEWLAETASIIDRKFPSLG
jgi:NAD(P)H dehydrogenase (quinone)